MLTPAFPQPAAALPSAQVEAANRLIHRHEVVPATNHLAFFLLKVFVFFFYSRILDITIPSLRLPLITGVTILILCLLDGSLAIPFRYMPTRYFVAFTAWMMFTIPFSIWKGNSFEILNSYWLRAIMTYFMIVGLARTQERCQQLIRTMFLGTLTAIFIGLALNATDREGRLCLPFGELGNSNAFGIAGVLGIIFGTYQILFPSGRFSRLIAIGGMVPMLWAIARTGSRTAMVMLAVTVIIAFFRLNTRQKIFFMLGTTIALTALLAVLPESLYKRYATLFATAEEVQGDLNQESAVESTESRIESLRKSIIITFQNPLVGVGPGNFMVAEAEMARAAGERPSWLQTHNGYTQISSETGLPGIIFYAAALFSVSGMIGRVAKLKVNSQAGRDLVFLAKYLQIGYISYAIAVFFGISLYSLYMPVLVGLMVATFRTAEEFLAAPQVADEPYVAPALRALSRLPLPGRNAKKA